MIFLAASCLDVNSLVFLFVFVLDSTHFWSRAFKNIMLRFSLQSSLKFPCNLFSSSPFFFRPCKCCGSEVAMHYSSSSGMNNCFHVTRNRNAKSNLINLIPSILAFHTDHSFHLSFFQSNSIQIISKMIFIQGRSV